MFHLMRSASHGELRCNKETLSGFENLRLQLSSWYWSSLVSWGFVLVAALMPEICIYFDIIWVWHECFKTETISPERLSSGRELTAYKLSQCFHIFSVSMILALLWLLLQFFYNRIQHIYLQFLATLMERPQGWKCQSNNCWLDCLFLRISPLPHFGL